tara:strand:+ start:13511 stop:14617 length:1107 start_codon:yes stop_codon:yes gene_type:complete
MKIVFISNTSWNLFNFRKHLIKKLILDGHSIHVITPIDKYTIMLKELGVIYHEIKLSRFHKTIFSDFLFIFKIIFKIYKIKPNIIHNFTFKPIIYVSLAVKLFRKIKVINSITGLGISFSNAQSFLNRFMLFLTRISFNKKHKFIFQNPDDMNFFIDKNLLIPNQCHLIRGSGVEIKNSKMDIVKKDNDIIFGFMSRMLWSKGIDDFIQAAEILIKRNSDTKFFILGSPDKGSPDSVPLVWLEKINNKKNFFWFPHKENVDDFLNQLDVFCLPTYYPEGLPKSLLEAAAMRLPLIATDTPGCREIVKNDINGFLVNVKNPKQLSDRMYELSINLELRKKMGNESFKIVSNEFSIDLVVKKTLKVYGLT